MFGVTCVQRFLRTEKKGFVSLVSKQLKKPEKKFGVGVGCVQPMDRTRKKFGVLCVQKIQRV